MKDSSKKLDLRLLQFMLKTIEDHLIFFAEQHPSDDISSQAMKILREDFDKTYCWCNDGDGLLFVRKGIIV